MPSPMVYVWVGKRISFSDPFYFKQLFKYNALK